MSCKKHYEKLASASTNILNQSFDGSREKEMGKAHSFVGDLEIWINSLATRSEIDVLRAANREYQFALLSFVCGHYRSAFASLRLSLELVLASIHWSANERELREWSRGERDTNWNNLIDQENGVLSKKFVRLFADRLSEEATIYRSMAISVYRECSEFVHGNAHTHRAVPIELRFDEQLFFAWHQRASAVRLTISFALAVRYLNELSTASRARLEDVLLDHLGHSEGVRSMLGELIEVPNG